MIRFEKIIQLSPNEEVVRVVRPTYLRWLFRVIFAFLLLLLPFFFLFPLFQFGTWGAGVFLLLVFFALWYSIRLFLMFFYNACVLTNERMIDIEQNGMFHRVISEVPWYKIEEILWERHGLFSTLFRYGTILIRLTNSPLKIELRFISKTEEVWKLMNRLSREFHEKSNSSISREAAATKPSENSILIDGDIRELSEEEIAELVKSIFGVLKDVESHVGKKKFEEIVRRFR